MTYPIEPTCQIDNLNAIYMSAFGYKTDGVFVEIGAYDGKTYSNTYGLASIGWKGHYIEPIRKYYDKCVENHSKHHNVHHHQVAISDHQGLQDFYTNGDLVTISPEMAAEVNADLFLRLPVTTLDALLESLQVDPGFDLLVIDVEGAESKVLKGFSILRWYPKLIIIETHEHSENEKFREFGKPVLDYFKTQPYSCVHSDHINSIYLLETFDEIYDRFKQAHVQLVANAYRIPPELLA